MDSLTDSSIINNTISEQQGTVQTNTGSKKNVSNTNQFDNWLENYLSGFSTVKNVAYNAFILTRIGQDAKPKEKMQYQADAMSWADNLTSDQLADIQVAYTTLDDDIRNSYGFSMDSIGYTRFLTVIYSNKESVGNILNTNLTSTPTEETEEVKESEIFDITELSKNEENLIQISSELRQKIFEKLNERGLLEDNSQFTIQSVYNELSIRERALLLLDIVKENNFEYTYDSPDRRKKDSYNIPDEDIDILDEEIDSTDSTDSTETTDTSTDSTETTETTTDSKYPQQLSNEQLNSRFQDVPDFDFSNPTNNYNAGKQIYDSLNLSQQTLYDNYMNYNGGGYNQLINWYDFGGGAYANLTNRINKYISEGSWDTDPNILNEQPATEPTTEPTTDSTDQTSTDQPSTDQPSTTETETTDQTDQTGQEQSTTDQEQPSTEPQDFYYSIHEPTDVMRKSIQFELDRDISDFGYAKWNDKKINFNNSFLKISEWNIITNSYRIDKPLSKNMHNPQEYITQFGNTKFFNRWLAEKMQKITNLSFINWFTTQPEVKKYRSQPKTNRRKLAFGGLVPSGSLGMGAGIIGLALGSVQAMQSEQQTMDQELKKSTYVPKRLRHGAVSRTKMKKIEEVEAEGDQESDEESIYFSEEEGEEQIEVEVKTVLDKIITNVVQEPDQEKPRMEFSEHQYTANKQKQHSTNEVYTEYFEMTDFPFLFFNGYIFNRITRTSTELNRLNSFQSSSDSMSKVPTSGLTNLVFHGNKPSDEFIQQLQDDASQLFSSVGNLMDMYADMKTRTKLTTIISTIALNGAVQDEKYKIVFGGFILMVSLHLLNIKYYGLFSRDTNSIANAFQGRQSFDLNKVVKLVIYNYLNDLPTTTVVDKDSKKEIFTAILQYHSQHPVPVFDKIKQKNSFETKQSEIIEYYEIVIQSMLERWLPTEQPVLEFVGQAVVDELADFVGTEAVEIFSQYHNLIEFLSSLYTDEFVERGATHSGTVLGYILGQDVKIDIKDVLKALAMNPLNIAFESDNKVKMLYYLIHNDRLQDLLQSGSGFNIGGLTSDFNLKISGIVFYNKKKPEMIEIPTRTSPTDSEVEAMLEKLEKISKIPGVADEADEEEEEEPDAGGGAEEEEEEEEEEPAAGGGAEEALYKKLGYTSKEWDEIPNEEKEYIKKRDDLRTGKIEMETSEDWVRVRQPNGKKYY